MEILNLQYWKYHIHIISDDELKKMKVDMLKLELRKRGLNTCGKKSELLEKLKKAMEDKIPLSVDSKTLVAPNGFNDGAKWRLLSSSEIAEEPSNVDPSLLDPSEARDKRNKHQNPSTNENVANKPTPVIKKIFRKNFQFPVI